MVDMKLFVVLIIMALAWNSSTPAHGQTVLVSFEIELVGVTDEMEAAALKQRMDSLSERWAKEFHQLIPVFEFVAKARMADVIQLVVVVKSVGTDPSSDIWYGFQIKPPGSASSIPVQIPDIYSRPLEFQTKGGRPSERLEDLLTRFQRIMFELDTENKRQLLLPRIPLGVSLNQCFKNTAGAVDPTRSVIEVPSDAWRRYAACDFVVECLASQGRMEFKATGTGDMHEEMPAGVIVSHAPLENVNRWLKVAIQRWYEMSVPATPGQSIIP